MKKTPDVSRRGVYYNLEISPWEYKTPHGDILKFSSKKKLEIFTRLIYNWRDKFLKLAVKNEEYLGDDWRDFTLKRAENRIYDMVYRITEGRGIADARKEKRIAEFTTEREKDNQ